MERTFFQYAGANACYGEGEIDWDRLEVEILHIGYLLLLPHLPLFGPGFYGIGDIYNHAARAANPPSHRLDAVCGWEQGQAGGGFS